MERDFVREGSIVRRIWGDGDIVLVVFAGCAAEFALNRAVDWLFFTGKLPGDPIGRLFSTAAYSQEIVFASSTTAANTLRRIRSVHEGVERARGEKIPDWAHRDVLYMLIDYSERAHEILDRPLRIDEKRELYDVFHRVGLGLGIPDLPGTYIEWRADRDHHLRHDLHHGDGTRELYRQYRLHLGGFRFAILRAVQSVLVPPHVLALLAWRRVLPVRWLLRLYPVLAKAGFRPLIRYLMMPAQHLPSVNALDRDRGIYKNDGQRSHNHINSARLSAAGSL